MIINKQDIFLGLDIGGSSVKYGWGNCKQGLLKFDKVALRGNSLMSIISAVNSIISIAEAEIGHTNILAVGIGVPGTIELSTGKLIGINPNLPQFTGLDPKSLFPADYGKEIFVDNDANLMTLAEAYQIPECCYVLGITLGTGIGCGFVQNKEIFHGAHGFSMELGHTTMVINGEKCNCGRRGCLEAYSSVTGLLNIVKKNLPDVSVKSLNEIVACAGQNDRVQNYLNDSITYLAYAISNAAAILDVDAVIIGGGLADIEGYPLQELTKKIIDLLPEILKNRIIVKKALHGNMAGTIGAIFLAENGYTIL